jgi:hypothetical protein
MGQQLLNVRKNRHLLIKIIKRNVLLVFVHQVFIRLVEHVACLEKIPITTSLSISTEEIITNSISITTSTDDMILIQRIPIQ